MLAVELIVYVVISIVIGIVVAAPMYRYAHWSSGWALGSGAAVAVVFGSQSWWSGLVHVYIVAISLILSALLGVFFFVASRRQGRRIRTAFVASALAFSAAAVLTFPIETHVVKLDMPNPR